MKRAVLMIAFVSISTSAASSEVWLMQDSTISVSGVELNGAKGISCVSGKLIALVREIRAEKLVQVGDDLSIRDPAVSAVLNAPNIRIVPSAGSRTEYLLQLKAAGQRQFIRRSGGMSFSAVALADHGPLPDFAPCLK